MSLILDRESAERSAAYCDSEASTEAVLDGAIAHAETAAANRIDRMRALAEKAPGGRCSEYYRLCAANHRATMRASAMEGRAYAVDQYGGLVRAAECFARATKYRALANDYTRMAEGMDE